MLEVSTRTIYRDLRDLSLSGVPVRGGPGEGYQLDPGYFLPPITFTADELEALRLGATMVARTTDDDLAAAARLALDRIDATVPPSRRLAPENLHSLLVETAGDTDIEPNLAAVDYIVVLLEASQRLDSITIGTTVRRPL